MTDFDPSQPGMTDSDQSGHFLMRLAVPWYLPGQMREKLNEALRLFSNGDSRVHAEHVELGDLRSLYEAFIGFNVPPIGAVLGGGRVSH